MGQLKQTDHYKQLKKKYFMDEEDPIKRSNADRSKRDRDKRKSHDQYSPQYLEETLWLQKHNPFDYRRKK
jgi:hypothetical protein